MIAHSGTMTALEAEDLQRFVDTLHADRKPVRVVEDLIRERRTEAETEERTSRQSTQAEK